MLLKFLCIALISIALAKAAAVSNEFPKFEGDENSTKGDPVIPNSDDGHQTPLEYAVTFETPKANGENQPTTVSSAVTEAGHKKPGGLFGVIQDVGNAFRDVVKKNADRFKHEVETILG